MITAGCTAPPAPPAPAPQNRSYTISEYEWSFSTSSIVVNLGDNITIHLKNNGTMQHDFTIDAPYSIHVTMNVNDTKDIVFVAATKGSFDYYCAVPGHKSLGMVGTLKVN